MVFLHYSLHMTMYCIHGHIICILAWHAPIMDNPSHNQHFNVLVTLGRGGGLRMSRPYSLYY